jgi:hypothetical protein
MDLLSRDRGGVKLGPELQYLTLPRWIDGTEEPCELPIDSEHRVLI